MQRLVDEGAHRAQVRELQGPVERGVPGLRREYRVKEGTNEKSAAEPTGRGGPVGKRACGKPGQKRFKSRGLEVPAARGAAGTGMIRTSESARSQALVVALEYIHALGERASGRGGPGEELALLLSIG